MIVVDTNVIAYFWIPGEHTESAEAVLLRDSAWCVPLLWRSEFRNVLATHVRRDRFDLAQARLLAGRAEEQLSRREYSVPSVRVLELAAESGLSAYDCEFVALAEDLDTTLVTTDRRLVQAFPERAVPAAEFAAGSDRQQASD